MMEKGVCEGVCGVAIERALFASGAFSVCLSCLTSAAWARERSRREAEQRQKDATTNIVGRVPLVRG